MSDHDITLRLSSEDDLPAIKTLNDLAFEQEDEGLIVERLYENDEALLALVAERDGALVGHIQFFPIDTSGMLPAKFAGLGPMSVHPDLQGTGLGGELIGAGLKEVKALGFQKVFVLGHAEYYPRFGFSVDETAGMAAPWGGPHFMAIELNPGSPPLAELHYPSAFFEG